MDSIVYFACGIKPKFKINKNKMSKILITGGAGFIGSNLCEYFLKKEHQVLCLDNFATGHEYSPF